MCVNMLIFTSTKWDESWHISSVWRGLIIGCMFCLPVEGPIVGARGGVSGGSRPSDKRGGGGHPVPEKKVGGAVSKKIFSAPVWSKNKGGGCPGSSPGSATWGML